ncbi:MAG: hypothetical protein QXQ53_08425 [Candidatus Methanosuratincola sp.]
MEFLKSIVSIAGFVISVTYILGALIVNLHLSRYGVIEYQILRVKYLAVGLNYLISAFGSTTVALVLAVALFGSNQITQQVLFAASLTTSLVLLLIGIRPNREKPKRTNKILERWPFVVGMAFWAFWIGMGAVCNLFPVLAIMHYILLSQNNLYSHILLGQAVLAGIIAVIGQIYFYSRHLYNRAVFDPIGMGIASVVQLSGESEKIAHLGNVGIPVLQPGLTDKLLLLDETENHYIVGVTDESNVQAVKVSKDIVKAIRYFGLT